MNETTPSPDFGAPDDDAMFAVLDDLNQRGQLPEVCGFDAHGRPFLAWLDEFGGDEVVPRVIVLGGETAEVSEPIGPMDLLGLSYPVTGHRYARQGAAS